MNRHFHFCYVIAHFIVRDGSASGIWAPKYLSYALALDFKGRDLEALLGIWNHFPNNLAGEKSTVYVGRRLADDVNSCVKSILSSGKSLNDFLSHLT